MVYLPKVESVVRVDHDLRDHWHRKTENAQRQNGTLLVGVK
jgi:hypothetical protein